jgi:hypothetical protein
MIQEFEKLNDREKEVMYQAPALVSVLIAGADNKIDKKEVKEALSLAELRTYRSRKVLREYYKDVFKVFEQQFLDLIMELPETAEERNPILEEKLRSINYILPKLDKKFSQQFHASLQDFAKSVAEASGGILGYLSISAEENRFVGLRMIRKP